MEVIIFFSIAFVLLAAILIIDNNRLRKNMGQDLSSFSRDEIVSLYKWYEKWSHAPTICGERKKNFRHETCRIADEILARQKIERENKKHR